MANDDHNGDDPRLLTLVESVLASARSLEDVCADLPPSLAAEVRRQCEWCRLIGAELSALFPATAGGREDGTEAPGAALPDVPGYELQAVLGRGGVGVVYRARHVRLRRTVAMKMLLSGAFAGPTERARFLREARAVAALRHPHVVQVYDVGEHDGRPFFTMELLAGGSLAARLGGAPLPAGEAARLAADLAGAVEAAHRAGIVHRDLKPANVLLADDGTPKVGDFGLALLADGGDGAGAEGGSADREPLALTLSGARLGTPSYMAPEQALGRRDVGPPADVYALGAILYEALTGRPPFRGESPTETERQVIEQDPVPPARLNPRVPRDLETIALKCLAKEPARRYASAAALGDDLRRFTRGEPILARRAGRVERLAKWVRRRPAVAGLWVAGAVTAAVVAASASSWALGRAAAARDVPPLLAVAAERLHSGDWATAVDKLDGAGARLGGFGLGELRSRLADLRNDADLGARLDAIGDRWEESFGKASERDRIDADYAAAFRGGGYGGPGAAPGVVADRIAASAARPSLVGALYRWSRSHGDAGDPTAVGPWIHDVLAAADPAPARWRDRALSSAAFPDQAAVDAAVNDPTLGAQLPSLLAAVAQRIHLAGKDDEPFLRRAQRAYPGDFWVNVDLLTVVMARGQVRDGVGFARAAVAARPKSSAAHRALGIALHRLAMAAGPADARGLLLEAAAEQRTALDLDPQSWIARINLGVVLTALGRNEEAVAELRPVSDGQPDNAAAHVAIGNSLHLLGRLDEAAAEYRAAIRLGPAGGHPPWNPELYFATAQSQLREVLRRQGKWDELIDVWRQQVESPAPPADGAWKGYAECCLYLGRAADYERVRPRLLEIAEASAEPRDWEVIGRACLLAPPADDAQLRRATALIDRALATGKPGEGYYRWWRAAKGLAEYRAGHDDEAIRIMTGDAANVLGPVPQLVVAMARHRLGQSAEARQALAQGAATFDWSAPVAVVADVHMYHVLRREAEGMILPHLPPFLPDGYEPRDAYEALAVAAACQAQGRYAAYARLWAAAYPSQRRFAAAARGYAARAAVLAGCRQGADADSLDDDGRARLRADARQWIADVLADAEQSKDPAARAWYLSSLKTIKSDGALDVVRRPASLDALPAAERREWADLWARVDAALAPPAATR